jgi:translation elongation factor EF-G
MMVDVRDADASSWFNTSATLIIVAAVVGIAYGSDRVYRRWLRENHPLAEYRARMDRLRTGYREKRANISEGAQVISEVLVEVTRATVGSDYQPT